MNFKKHGLFNYLSQFNISKWGGGEIGNNIVGD